MPTNHSPSFWMKLIKTLFLTHSHPIYLLIKLFLPVWYWRNIVNKKTQQCSNTCSWPTVRTCSWRRTRSPYNLEHRCRSSRTTSLPHPSAWCPANTCIPAQWDDCTSLWLGFEWPTGTRWTRLEKSWQPWWKQQTHRCLSHTCRRHSLQYCRSYRQVENSSSCRV